MDPIDELKRTLSRTNRSAFQGLEFDLASIEKVRKALEDWLGTGWTERPSRDLMREALTRFHATLRFESFADARLVCFGCTEDCGPLGVLIEDAKSFPRMLECVEEWRSEPRPFRRCYGALLGSYFRYDPDGDSTPASGRRNWEALRTYLYDRRGSLRAEGVVPEWMLALKEHSALLTEDACDRYAKETLDGNAESFEDAHRRLEIGEASWVIHRYVLAQIRAAVRLVDRRYHEQLPRLLELLSKHVLVQDKGLAELLERYARCTPPAIHPPLRDTSVALWGNPWLDLNKTRWNLVSNATRAMVTDWLKLEIIHQFFSLLSEDGSNDTRRLRFWQRYHRKIDDMHFALGPRAMNARSRDFVSLRSKMHGRVVELVGGGNAANNAFIMKMGEYVVVELGVKGNACFVFRRSEGLPFKLDEALHADRAEWRERARLRLLHRDGILGHARWEDRFEEELYTLIRYRPAANEKLPPGAAPSPLPPPKPHITPKSHTKAANTGSGRISLEALRSQYNLDVDDLRHKGGNLWVRADDSDDLLAHHLRALGFEYKPGKGWWQAGS